MMKYGLDATDTWLDNIGKNKNDLHDAIPIEADANTYEAKFKKFYDGENFVRLRNVNGKKVQIQDNRVINLLKAMEDAMNKYNNAKNDKEKAKQKERYNANFNSLVNLVDEFKEKERNSGQQNQSSNQQSQANG